jgi:predicted transcriptional regulator
LIRFYRKRMTPSEIWDALGVSKQGALNLLRPLIKAGLVGRVATKKEGRYFLTQRRL